MQKRFYLYKQNSTNKDFYTTDEMIVKGIKRARKFRIYEKLFMFISLFFLIFSIIVLVVGERLIVLIGLYFTFISFFVYTRFQDKADELFEQNISKYKKSSEYKKLSKMFKNQNDGTYQDFAINDIIDKLKQKDFIATKTYNYILTNCDYDNLSKIFAQVLVINESEYKITYTSEDGQQEASVFIIYQEI